MFVYKTQEEYDAMSAAEQAKYLVDKRTHEAELVKAQIQEQIENAQKNNASKEDIQKLEDTNAKIVKEIEELSIRMKSLTEAPAAGADKRLAAAKELVSKTREVLSGAIKEYVAKALTLRSSIANNSQAVDLTDVGQLATRRLAMYDLFPKFPVGDGNHNGTIRYYDWDEATTVRAAAMRAEGAAFPESTATWKRGTITLQKVGDTLPVTEEFLTDEVMFAAELDFFLQTNVALVVDNQIANGDGLSNNLTGLVTSAPAFTAVASGITDASIYDLIVKVSESITTTGGAKYVPNFAVMNIADINKMKLKKDANYNYVLPPFVTRDGQEVAGIVVIEANCIAANTMVVGDSRFGRIYEMPGVEISRGHVGTQFTEDEITIKARKRLAFLIREADKSGFRKVTSISAALTTLAS
jgi:hypothetical protein